MTGPDPTQTPTTDLQNDLEVTGNFWAQANATVAGNLAVTGSSTFTGGSVYTGPVTAPSLILTGTSHNATVAVAAGLGQASAITIPDPGGATGTFALLQTANIFTGVNTFPVGGIVLKGTSHNNTIASLAAQGQATALTIDDVGGATGFIYTFTNAQSVAGKLSRADAATVAGSTIHAGILNIKNLDGTTLASSAGAGVFGISTTATFGSPAQLSLVTEVANNNTKTDSCEFEVVLPVNYVAGSAISVNVGQNITIGGGTLSAKTLTVDAFLVAADGTVGSNLGPAAQTLTNAQTTLTFAITPTGLVAGNKLLIQMQTVLTETASSAVHANLTSVTVTTTTQM